MTDLANYVVVAYGARAGWKCRRCTEVHTQPGMSLADLIRSVHQHEDREHGGHPEDDCHLCGGPNISCRPASWNSPPQTRGHPMSDPMPVFPIKATDQLADAAITAYRNLCTANGLHEQADQVDLAIGEMIAWQLRHPDLVHLPDHAHVDANDMTAPSDAGLLALLDKVYVDQLWTVHDGVMIGVAPREGAPPAARTLRVMLTHLARLGQGVAG